MAHGPALQTAAMRTFRDEGTGEGGAGTADGGSYYKAPGCFYGVSLGPVWKTIFQGVPGSGLTEHRLMCLSHLKHTSCVYSHDLLNTALQTEVSEPGEMALPHLDRH